MSRPSGARDDHGFTLVELLVVMIIIAILSAIAVPAYLGQRRAAWNTAAASDARQAAGVVAAASDGSTYATVTFRDDAAIAALAAPLSEFRRSPDVGTAVHDIRQDALGPGPAGFCVISYHDRARAWTMYDSSQGMGARGFTTAQVSGGSVAERLADDSPCKRLRPTWSTMMRAARGS